MKTYLHAVMVMALTGALIAPTTYAAEGTDAEVRAATFKALDVDGNGLLSEEEAAADDKVAEEYPHADGDGDGMINMEEFMKMKFSDE